MCFPAYLSFKNSARDTCHTFNLSYPFWPFFVVVFVLLFADIEDAVPSSLIKKIAAYSSPLKPNPAIPDIFQPFPAYSSQFQLTPASFSPFLLM